MKERQKREIGGLLDLSFHTVRQDLGTSPKAGSQHADWAGAKASRKKLRQPIPRIGDEEDNVAG